jgi:intraflagellar transport protein 88
MKPTTQQRQPSRMGTSLGQSERPTTSNKAVGYSKNMGQKGPKTTSLNMLFTKKEPSREQIIKDLERLTSKLLDESIISKCKNDLYDAKDKCLKAMERINEFKRKHDPQYFNSELEFGIKLNLGLVYQQMKNYDEAKIVFNEILKNESNFIPGIQVARVRVNIGNIFYEEGKYKDAIKEYQKAYDKISRDNKVLRANIAKNIGLAQAKLGLYSDAITYYENANSLSPEVKTTMNLLLCQLVIQDTKKENLLKNYNLILEIYAYITERDLETNQITSLNSSLGEDNFHDGLKEYLTNQKKDYANIITTIGLILTKFIDKKEPMNAYESIIDSLKKNGIKDIINEFEMAKAMYFLKKRDIEKTILIMKSFENKDKSLISRVSNSVSFLYFIEGNMAQAENYANIALENERYNHKALVNKGNIFFYKENYLRAKDFYLEAIGVQSDCVEAIYNLGMINERMESFYEALQAYDKLNTVVPNIPEVLYKIGRMSEKVKDYDSALKYYNLLLNQLNANGKDQDPVLLSSIGNLYYTINVSKLIILF